MIQSRVLLALLSFVDPLPRKETNTKPTFNWTLAQIEELQLHALAALAILLPRSVDEYFEYHVGTRLLLYYEWAINKGKYAKKIQNITLQLNLDEYKSQGHSFFGKGGRNNKRSQLRYVLRLIRSIVSVKDERIATDLCDQGLIPLLTGLIESEFVVCLTNYLRFD